MQWFTGTTGTIVDTRHSSQIYLASLRNIKVSPFILQNVCWLLNSLKSCTCVWTVGTFTLATTSYNELCSLYASPKKYKLWSIHPSVFILSYTWCQYFKVLRNILHYHRLYRQRFSSKLMRPWLLGGLGRTPVAMTLSFKCHPGSGESSCKDEL